MKLGSILFCLTAVLTSPAYAISDPAGLTTPNFDLLPSFKNQNTPAEQATFDRIYNQGIRAKDPEPVRPTGGPLFAEGSGTRGGGSGVISVAPDGTMTGELLDIYRSRHLDRFPKFHELDPSLVALARGLDPEKGSELVIADVLKRLNQHLPGLGAAILETSRQLPFSSWTAVTAPLPLIDDYIGRVELGATQTQVQIAYRRTDQIVYNVDRYRSLDGFNRAALKLHEWIYALSNATVSIAVQRIVSLIMSADLESAEKLKAERELFVIASLTPLLKTSPLVEGVAFTAHAEPRAGDICGLVKEVAMDKAQDGKGPSATISIVYDPAHPLLTLQDLSLENGFGAKLALSKPAWIKVKAAEFMRFIAAFSRIKAELSVTYPIYKYPAQRVVPDIVCVNASKRRMTSLESGLDWNPDKNEREMKAARSETAYLRAFNRPIATPEAFAKVGNLVTELMIYHAQTKSDEAMGLLNLYSGKPLGRRSVEFTTKAK